MAAHGTGWHLIDGHKQPELLIDTFNTFQKPECERLAGLLANGSGEVPLPQQPKTLVRSFVVVATRCTKSAEEPKWS